MTTSTDIDITLTLNGQEHTLTVDPKRPALSVLREELGQRSLTAGCSPQGICGCCAALVNGKPRLTCTLRAKSLHGKTVETQASFTAQEQAALTTAFTACGATQCGYCTSGITTQAIGLLRRNPAPEPEAIDKALNQHICRCTGWTRIRQAIQLTGKLLAEESPALPPGLSTPATEAAVLGRRTRIDDMTRPGMVHVAPCFAPHARCLITEISAPDGVTVLTAADIPQRRPAGQQPLLVAAGEETRCAADAVALAIGATAAEARLNAAAIQVTATPLEPTLHADVGEITAEHHIQHGAAPAAGAVAHTVSADISVAAADPAFLEPDAALAVPLAGPGLHVYSHAQDLFAERAQLAAMTGLDADAIRVEAVACGGAFAGRSSVLVAGWAALAAFRLERPARVALLHEEGVRLHAGRPAAQVSVTVQADSDGNLLSVDGELLVNAGGYGAFAEGMTQRAARLMAGPYRTPHLDVRARCARTNSPPAGAGRGLGGLPGTVAIERCMDLLAEATGQDAVDIRARNLAQAHHKAPLEAVATAYQAARKAGRPAGFACAAQGLGLGGPETVRVVLAPQPTGEIRIYTGFPESGQGFEPRAVRAAADASGLPAERFVVVSDTAHPVDSGPAIAGRDHWLGLQAIRDAATALGQAGPVLGRTFVGEAHAAVQDGQFTAMGFAAEAVILNDKGGIDEVVVAVDAGDSDDPVGTGGQVEGAVHMGLGAALSELRFVQPDGLPDTQYRKLGVLKSRVSPTIHATLCASDGPRPIDDAAMLATVPAVAAALRSRGDDPGEQIPMISSVTAKAAGVKPPKPKRARS